MAVQLICVESQRFNSSQAFLQDHTRRIGRSRRVYIPRNPHYQITVVFLRVFHRSSDVVVGGESVPKPSQRFQAIVVSLQQAVGNPLPLIWELKGAVFYCSSNNVLPAPSAPPPGAPWWLRSHSMPQPNGETQGRGRGLVWFSGETETWKMGDQWSQSQPEVKQALSVSGE